ncbi:MAG: 3',5'-cyclic-AMP phosphodiesterase [Leptolyngbyaceae cyanobacterium bins.59]|nr:3',5'-cyclic-AMP phosphodiesterase [Leptolyngbyaceae cyanobacterium bins.59]
MFQNSVLQNSVLRIAQVSDIHFFASEKAELLGLTTDHSFRAVLNRLEQIRSEIDLVLLTGDLSQDGSQASYERLQSLIRPLQLPTYWLPGNHDIPLVMQQVLTKAPVFSEKSFQAGSWHFVLLNSHAPGHVYGKLSPDHLAWLDEQLQQVPDRPTLLALHHPPFLVDSNWLDTSTLQNSPDLFAIVDRHPQVKLVLFGHIHQEFHRQRSGVDYLGVPSTSIQFEPQSTRFSLDSCAPGFRLLTLYSDGTWGTQVERVAYKCVLDLAAKGY